MKTTHLQVKTTLLSDKHSFPLMISPAVDGIEPVRWASESQDWILARLAEHGALLFRGFDLPDGEAFEHFAESLCPTLFGEYGDLPPDQGRIYHSTPYPKDKAILFHNEASHTPRWPMKQFFYCVKVARVGGNTPIVDCRQVYQRLSPETIQKFHTKKLLYVRNFSPGLDVSWQDFFKTQSRQAVEDICRGVGAEVTWHEDDTLTVKQLCHGVVQHPRTKEWTFFNQVQLHHPSCLDAATREALESIFGDELMPRNVYYGDGSRIEESVMEEIDKAYWDLSISAPWQERDVIMLDNMLIAHARSPFEGERKILVAMGDMMNRSDLVTA